MTTTTTINLTAALTLARRGTPVGPLWPLREDGTCSCPQPRYASPDWSCRSPGKHPICRRGAARACTCPAGHACAVMHPDKPHADGQHYPVLKGCEAYTVDPYLIASWWSRYPDAGIGIDLDRAVLVDIAPDSPKWDAEFQRRGIPEGAAIFTSGGGDGHRHYLMRRPADCPILRDCRSGEFDIISNGNDVLPPTRHTSGAVRAWLVPLPTDLADLPEAPAWVVDHLREREAATPAKGSARRGVAPLADLPDTPATFTDDAALERARSVKSGEKFSRLFYGGNWQAEGFRSWSEASDYLFARLAHATADSPGQMRRLHDDSALAHGEERGESYYASTIAHALSLHAGCYGCAAAVRVNRHRAAPVLDDLTEAPAADLCPEEEPEPAADPLSNLESSPPDPDIDHCPCCQDKDAQIATLAHQVERLTRQRDQVVAKFKTLADQLITERAVQASPALGPTEKHVAIAAVRDVYRKAGAGDETEVYVGAAGKGGIVGACGTSRRTALTTLEKLDRLGVWERRTATGKKTKPDGTTIEFTRVFVTPRAASAADALRQIARYRPEPEPGKSANGLGGARKRCPKHRDATIDQIGICRRCRTVVDGGPHHADLEGVKIQREPVSKDDPPYVPTRTCAQDGCTIRTPENAVWGWLCNEHFAPAGGNPLSNLESAPPGVERTDPGHAPRADQHVQSLQAVPPIGAMLGPCPRRCGRSLFMTTAGPPTVCFWCAPTMKLPCTDAHGTTEHWQVCGVWLCKACTSPFIVQNGDVSMRGGADAAGGDD